VFEALNAGRVRRTHIYAVSAALGVVVQSRMPTITAGYDHYTRRVVARGVCAQAALRFTVMRVPQRAADFVANHFVLLATRFYDAGAADCDNRCD